MFEIRDNCNTNANVGFIKIINSAKINIFSTYQGTLCILKMGINF